MKPIIIIPTYNEKNNIVILIEQIEKIDKTIDVLVIDDNSPDGTSNVIKNKMQIKDNLYIHKRESKLGLGTAYLYGFKWAIDKGYDRVIQMDADLSHDPNEITNMLMLSENNDVVIGSRYINGVNVVNWPMRRLLLSYFANKYAQIVTGLPVKDATAGFKCYTKKAIINILNSSIKSEGYSFQIETVFYSWINSLSIIETPIIFNDRTVGESKMSTEIIFEAVWIVLKLRLKRIFK